MTFKTLAVVTVKEHILVYVLASMSNVILLIPQWQLATRAGLSVEIPRSVALYQVLIGVLLALLTISGTIRKRWKWEYVMIGLLTAGYVGYRLSTRFVAGLEAVSRLAASGVSVVGDVSTLYSYGLGAALAYTGMILVMRRAYNKLVTYKSVDRRPDMESSRQGSVRVNDTGDVFYSLKEMVHSSVLVWSVGVGVG